MRESRGKRYDGEGWAYGLPTRRIEKCKFSKLYMVFVYIQTCNVIDGTDMLTEYRVHPETVGEFTGKKDKNKTKVYEGDKVLALTTYMANALSEASCTGKPEEYVVGFDDGTFNFCTGSVGAVRQWDDGTNDWTSIENVEDFDIEVIGTIHDGVKP